jgi:hypothetical protein
VTLLTRREWLALTGSAAAFAQRQPPSEIRARIAKIIDDYGSQGIHRTGTGVDRASGEWLMQQVQAAGLEPEREAWNLSRVDPLAASITISGKHVDGLPLFDGGFTPPEGVHGRIGELGSDAEIGLTEAAPNTTGSPKFEQARKSNRHRALIIVTRGGRPGLCPSNAESFLKPFGVPVLQVSSEEKKWLDDAVSSGAPATLIAHVRRSEAEAFNVLAKIAGADASLPPLIVMTPRSGWWTCASERGGGIACWLEMMRSLRSASPARDILFVASSGHEIGQRGIEVYTERRAGLTARSRAWIHLGANIGAAQDPGNVIQASDDEMEALLAGKILSAGMQIERRVPRGTVPGGEAGVIHRGGGRYVSVIGRSALFHNPMDIGPEAVDVEAIARFAGVFTAVATALSRAS